MLRLLVAKNKTPFHRLFFFQTSSLSKSEQDHRYSYTGNILKPSGHYIVYTTSVEYQNCHSDTILHGPHNKQLLSFLNSINRLVFAGETLCLLWGMNRNFIYYSEEILSLILCTLWSIRTLDALESQSHNRIKYKRESRRKGTKDFLARTWSNFPD
jgi:hypothetical protein